jgi:beta-hydroxylase
VAIRPAEAELLHPYQHGDRIDLHLVDDRFFHEHDPEGLKQGGPPPHPLWGVAPAPHGQVPVELVANLAGVPIPARATPDGSLQVAAAGDLGGGVETGTGAEPAGRRLRRAAVASVLRLNTAAIGAGVGGPAVLDTSGLDWVERLEAGWAEVRAEVDALLAADVRLPLMAELLGADQGDEGRWRALALVARGRVVERTANRLPATLRSIQQVPGLQSALLSSFPPGMHLPAHRGPNKGVLRYHLGIVVPEPEGACGLRVGDVTVIYAEGRSILFDDTYEHEAWNHTAGERISLFLEVRRPLPAPLRLLNDGVQGFYGVHPEATGVAARAEELDVALNGRLPT